VAGSRCSVPVGVDAANAVDFCPRSCHLCFDPSHFIVDCPLLGNETLKLAQERRENKFKDTSNPCEPGQALSTFPAKRMPPRSMGFPRQWQLRGRAIAVNAVLPPSTEQEVVPIQVFNNRMLKNELRERRYDCSL
jgi:hypothetical protein